MQKVIFRNMKRYLLQKQVDCAVLQDVRRACMLLCCGVFAVPLNLFPYMLHGMPFFTHI